MTIEAPKSSSSSTESQSCKLPPLLNLPSELKTKILQKLSIIDLSKALLSTKMITIFDENLFKERLRIDFESVFMNVKDGKYQKAYNIEYKKYQQLLTGEYLPGVVYDDGSILVESLSDGQALFNKLICSPFFESEIFCSFAPSKLIIYAKPYIEKLSRKNFQTAFHMACGLGCAAFLKLLIEDKKFEKFSISDAFGLADCFSQASKNDQIEIMRLIMELPKFKHITAIEKYGLGFAYTLAAANNSVKAMELIETLENFKVINPFGENSLGDALYRATQNNQLDAIRHIMNIQKFIDIPLVGPYGLGATLFEAAHENFEAFELLLKNARFSQIPVNDDDFCLGNTFIAACTHNNVRAIKLLMSDPRFDEISSYYIYSAIFNSAIWCQLSSIKKVALSRRVPMVFYPYKALEKIPSVLTRIKKCFYT